jgi:hypothetical protein
MTELQNMVFRDALRRLETEHDIFITGAITEAQMPRDTDIRLDGYEGAVEQVLMLMLNTDDVKYLRGVQ